MNFKTIFSAILLMINGSAFSQVFSLKELQEFNTISMQSFEEQLKSRYHFILTKKGAKDGTAFLTFTQSASAKSDTITRTFFQRNADGYDIGGYSMVSYKLFGKATFESILLLVQQEKGLQKPKTVKDGNILYTVYSSKGTGEPPISELIIIAGVPDDDKIDRYSIDIVRFFTEL